MKAISPIVATVLLIAIVVVAFGILNAWVFNFTKTSTGDLKTEGTRQTVCANSDVSFNVLKYCNNSLSGIIFNSGMIPLGNFTIYVIYQNGTQQLFELNNTSGSRLSMEAGSISKLNISISSNYNLIGLLTNCTEKEYEIKRSSISTSC